MIPIGEMGMISIPLPEFEAKLDLEKRRTYVPRSRIFMCSGAAFSQKAIEYPHICMQLLMGMVSAIRHNFDKSVEETDTETANSGNSEYSFTNDGDTWERLY